MRKGFMIGLLAGLLVAGSGCGNKPKQEAEAASVKLFTVKGSGETAVQEFPGRVKAAEEVNLSFKVSGRLQRIGVDEGSRIRKGQLLAEMDPTDYRTQMDAVEAEYQSVKAEAERVISLYRDSVGTADQYDKARYGLQQITAKRENARHQLADTRLYAPFDGSVQSKLTDAPAVVGAGMPVLTVVSDGRQEVEINVPAQTKRDCTAEARFTTAFDFLPGQAVELTLLSVSPKANANQLYTVRLSLPQGLSQKPSPGMNVMVRMSAAGTADTAVEVPSSAIYNKGKESCAWVYDPQTGTIGERSVTVARLTTTGNAILSAGLSAGEQIVAVGTHKLTDGQRVKPMAAESETNIGNLM